VRSEEGWEYEEKEGLGQQAGGASVAGWIGGNSKQTYWVYQGVGVGVARSRGGESITPPAWLVASSNGPKNRVPPQRDEGRAPPS